MYIAGHWHVYTLPAAINFINFNLYAKLFLIWFLCIHCRFFCFKGITAFVAFLEPNIVSKLFRHCDMLCQFSN